MTSRIRMTGMLATLACAVPLLLAQSAPAHADGWYRYDRHGYDHHWGPHDWDDPYWGPHYHHHHRHVSGVFVYEVPPPPPPPIVVQRAPVVVQAPPAVAEPQPYCREYTSTANINGKPVQTYGTACRQPDGTWRIVSMN